MTATKTEIDRISADVQNAHLKVIEKGGTSNAPFLVANLASAIESIKTSPDGLVAFKTGTITFTSDQGKYFYVQHDLGAVPNVFMLYYAGDIDSANFTDELFCNIFTGKHINTPEYRYIGVQLTLGAYDGDVAHNVTWMADGHWLVDETVIELTRTDYYKCKAGMTYNWIAARIEDLE